MFIKLITSGCSLQPLALRDWPTLWLSADPSLLLYMKVRIAKFNGQTGIRRLLQGWRSHQHTASNG